MELVFHEMRNGYACTYILTCAIVSGNFAPRVSGKKMAKRPPTRLEPPMIIKGALPLSPASNGATIPPILAIIEAVPTALFRMTVGYNSAVYK